MAEQKIVFCDVDGTVALTHEEWFMRYNIEWKDNLTYDHITDWGVHAFVKESCGTQIYKYLNDDDLYDNVQPYPGSVVGVEILRKRGFRVVFLTSGLHKGKISFLRRWGFLEKTGDKDFVVAHDKGLIDGKGAILIDDGYHNVKAFKGISILLDAPHNRKYNHLFRAMDWNEVVAYAIGIHDADHMARYMSYGS
jgi:5'(3')-deoxyribonucleotidase